MARNFNEILAEIDAGALIDLLSEKCAQVTRGVEETGKIGSISLTLKFKQNKGGQLIIQSEVKAKPPEQGVADAIFFADGEGNLSRRDPRQSQLFDGLRDVKALPQS